MFILFPGQIIALFTKPIERKHGVGKTHSFGRRRIWILNCFCYIAYAFWFETQFFRNILWIFLLFSPKFVPLFVVRRHLSNNDKSQFSIASRGAYFSVVKHFSSELIVSMTLKLKWFKKLLFVFNLVTRNKKSQKLFWFKHFFALGYTLWLIPLIINSKKVFEISILFNFWVSFCCHVYVNLL